MSAHGFFLEDDQLLPIWRFFLSLVLILGGLTITSEIVGTVVLMTASHPGLPVIFFWHSVVGLAVLLGSFKVMLAVFDRRAFGSMGLGFHQGWCRELGTGLLLGASMMLLIVAAECALGVIRFSYESHPVAKGGGFAFALFAIAATLEEVIFRGYAFQRLAEAISFGGAAAVTSLFFGLVHIANPHHSWISTANTMLIGVAFCIAYWRTRSLWLPVGMHFVWNFLMGFLLGLPVSGLAISSTLLTAQVRGPQWLAGGEYGPEGGAMATLAALLAIAYLTLSKGIYTGEEMKALVSAPPAPRKTEPPIGLFSSLPEDEAKRD